MIKMNKFIYSGKSEITPLTMVVSPYLNKQGGLNSRILEGKTEYIVSDSPSKVMDRACRFFGIDLKGRQNGTKQILNLTHKLPISIDPHSGMYFFPTKSPANPKCIWLNHTHIEDIEELESKRTKVIFKNSLTIDIDVSYGSMMNQINRTAQYRFILDSRIKGLQKGFNQDV